jgi:hypothetical protein
MKPRGRDPARLDLALRVPKNAEHRGERQADDRKPRRQRQEAKAARRIGVGAALELVSETVDREIDVDEVHNALAALLVSFHRKRQAAGGST